MKENKCRSIKLRCTELVFEKLISSHFSSGTAHYFSLVIKTNQMLWICSSKAKKISGYKTPSNEKEKMWLNGKHLGDLLISSHVTHVKHFDYDGCVYCVQQPKSDGEMGQDLGLNLNLIKLHQLLSR